MHYLSMLSTLLGLSALAVAVPAPAADIADVADASRFTFYDMPSAEAGPCDLCTGPDGSLWGEDFLKNKIFRIDKDTRAVTEYDIPFTNAPLPVTDLPLSGGQVAFACAIRPGADGMLYASSGIRNQLVQINPTSKKIKIFTPTPPNPAGDLQPFNDMWTGKDGMYFTQTTANVISYFDYATHNFTSYPIPTPEGSPLGMFVASDGLVYTVEFVANKLARLHPKTGKIEEFPLPASLITPAVVRVETENRYVWFTSLTGDALGRFDMQTHDIKAFPQNDPGAFAAEEDVTKNGNIFISQTNQEAIAYLTPSTGMYTTVRIPGTLVPAPISLPYPFGIAVHYGPGNAIWFTEVVNNRVGRYQLKGAQ